MRVNQDLCKKYHLSKATIQRYLLSGTKLRLCNYDGNKNKIHYKKIICITENKIFDSIKCAGEYYDLDTSGLVKCCRGKYNTYGKLEDGTKLQWMYYEDYLKSTTS